MVVSAVSGVGVHPRRTGFLAPGFAAGVVLATPGDTLGTVREVADEHSPNIRPSRATPPVIESGAVLTPIFNREPTNSQTGVPRRSSPSGWVEVTPTTSLR